jgi:hypothetical protein
VGGWWLGSRQPVSREVIVQPGVSRTP